MAAAADEKEIRVKGGDDVKGVPVKKGDTTTTEKEKDVIESKETKQEEKEPKKEEQPEHQSKHSQKETAKHQGRIEKRPQAQPQQQVTSPSGKSATNGIPIQPYGYAAAYPYYPAAMAPSYSASSSIHMLTGTNNPYTYTDVSGMGDPAPDTRRNRGGVVEPFPEKLHRMLESVEREGLQEIVSFHSHGRSFAIHKPRMFVEKIMPRFFRQTRLTSFQRQLNLYGFRRMSQGPDNGGYYHELFLKGRPGLCVNMKRMKVKGTQKLKRDPETEPNFYTYPPLPEKGSTAVAPSGLVSNGVKPSNTSPASGTSPQAHAPYTTYPYPPHQYGYAPLQAAPYTAAQQPGAPSVAAYAYPPYYSYPWYTQATHLGSLPTTTPETSPMKGGAAMKTPGTPTTNGPGTPASTSSPKQVLQV